MIKKKTEKFVNFEIFFYSFFPSSENKRLFQEMYKTNKKNSPIKNQDSQMSIKTAPQS